ncbi:DUF6205 family protein [Kitasatospora sp. NPDC101157]|uniref:DUF6205 family protein n=1 Tax=Kitasatospora sp. NPDC101157 TaxID=3364098 RepID=UPI0037FA97A0
MGAYDSYFTGHITIAPPLTWAQIRNSTAGPLNDLRIGTAETVDHTPTGKVTTVIGEAIVPLTEYGAYGGHHIHTELQAIIDGFPEHQFAGAIEARPQDPGGDPWRYIVRDRTVIRQVPKTTWIDSEEQQ